MAPQDSSYDAEMREALRYYMTETPIQDLRSQGVIDAIPPLTLKTEDGRFVKVEPHRIGGWDIAVPGLYHIVDDQP